jgi:plasmid replication initiation protein
VRAQTKLDITREFRKMAAFLNLNETDRQINRLTMITVSFNKQKGRKIQ